MAHQLQTVVVGGGVGGLTAAAYLARGGAAVTMIEKAAALGGRAATDYVKGFALNRGAHAFYTGAAGSSVLRELGVTYGYGVPTQVYALDGRGLHRLPTTPLDLLRTSLLDVADKRELLGFFLRLGSITPSSVATVSTADWIDSIAHRPKVRTLLRSVARVQAYSEALDLVSADIQVARLQQAARNPVHYVNGGWQTIVEGLRDVATRAGVVIRPSSGADSIRVVEGRAVAIRLHDQQELAADAVVLAMPPEDAAHLVSEPKLKRRLSQMVPAHIACLDVALQRLPNPRQPVVFDMQQPRFITAQSTVAQLGPNGGGVIHLFKQLDPRVPTDPHTDAADLEALLDLVQPGWRDVVVERRFLPRMLGSSMIPLATEGGLGARVGYQSEDIPNVFFAGDWVGPNGYLVDASFSSAREAANLILTTANARSELQQAA